MLCVFFFTYLFFVILKGCTWIILDREFDDFIFKVLLWTFHLLTLFLLWLSFDLCECVFIFKIIS